MEQLLDLSDPKGAASRIDAEVRALPIRNTANIRAVRRKYTRELSRAAAAFVMQMARELIENYSQRWLAYEFVKYHKAAFQSVGEAELEEFGRGMNSWDSVDSFARILSGPVWKNGQASDELIHRWARSEDVWWRRAALVSTVAWNMRSQGGKGDVPRTLAVCKMLAGDREDMVEKAMSWALRQLVVCNAEAVSNFLNEHEASLAARVKREVRNKLTTGLKNPRTTKSG